MIACVLVCCAVVSTDSWCVATSRGYGQAWFTSSLSRAHLLSLPTYLICAPVAGFIGLLQDSRSSSCYSASRDFQEDVERTFCVLDLLSSASSSSCLDMRRRLLCFGHAHARSLWGLGLGLGLGLVLGLVLVLIYDDNRMSGVLVVFSFVIAYIMAFFIMFFFTS